MVSSQPPEFRQRFVRLGSGRTAGRTAVVDFGITGRSLSPHTTEITPPSPRRKRREAAARLRRGGGNNDDDDRDRRRLHASAAR
ncbi:hypothetical protein HPB50_021617 [Hyalomma asiaticum]|uniref:Uncharacterized protein n=1 Tax=Hyalomma asiaticum TaxID=266040 RepID=A0ACB7SYW3_HYAAI|nr:hypothetical protein HPB50_021617 [Hyalomma asiaticum]